MKFIEKLSKDKKSRLMMWQSRYSKQEYPMKIAENLLYEGLTCSNIWDSNHYSFNGESYHKYFEDAWNDVYNATVRSVQTGNILPILNQIYLDSSKNYLEEIDFPSFKKRCEACSQYEIASEYAGKIEEIEVTYFYYTGAYMCIYGMYSLSLMGYNKTDALYEITGIALNENNINDYKTLISAIGTPLNMYYNN